MAKKPKKAHKAKKPAAKAKAPAVRAKAPARPVAKAQARTAPKAQAKAVKAAHPEKPAKGAKGAKAAAEEEKPLRKGKKGEPEAKGPLLRKPARPLVPDAGTEEGEEGEEAPAAAKEDDELDDDKFPVDDMSDITEGSRIKELVARGREKGFVTYDEVNDALPADIASDQIDDVMSMFGEHDIEVVDDASKMKLPEKPPEPEAKEEKEEKEEEEEDAGYGKSNDPVRMYLRKMGSVSLLTREGEVEIAKRIEEGEKEILAAVLSSSIAIREILDLGDRLRKGKIRVREIIKDQGDESQAEAEEEEVEEVAARRVRPRADLRAPVGRRREGAARARR
ncbi:MAG: RNA polymerase sigma factor RpoD, partial [Candidatus Aminicenantes bacterium]|nr:RNA polymerase sigma factor RpoD [Candidatus Aminicenantes bacterium]